MNVALHSHLENQENAENFVANSLVRFGQSAGEDVSEAESAFAEHVVRSAEVEDGETQGIDG